MARRTNLKQIPRKRYKHDQSLTPLPPDVAISSATHAAGSPNVTIVFGAPVQYNSPTPPASLRIGGKTPVSYISKNALGCVIAMTANVAAAEALTIASNDPAIRTPAGGFVQATQQLTL